MSRGHMKTELGHRPLKEVASQVWSQIAVFASLVFVCLIGGCSSVTYHQPVTPEINQGGVRINCGMGDRSCIFQASGDSSILSECVRYDALVNYYRNFRPNAEYNYYDIEIVLVGKDSVARDLLMDTTTSLRFDFVSLSYGKNTDTLQLSGLPQRKWRNSVWPAASVEPLPIPKDVSSAKVRIMITVLSEKVSMTNRIISVTIPIERKRLLRTLLNPWP